MYSKNLVSTLFKNKENQALKEMASFLFMNKIHIFDDE